MRPLLPQRRTWVLVRCPVAPSVNTGSLHVVQPSGDTDGGGEERVQHSEGLVGKGSRWSVLDQADEGECWVRTGQILIRLGAELG